MVEMEYSDCMSISQLSEYCHIAYTIAIDFCHVRAHNERFRKSPSNMGQRKYLIGCLDSELLLCSGWKTLEV